MKKMDNTRSHSWWWDSHQCPKNSKWLQDNLSEMDSKVSAMLKIIEEDADSFAQRAEMYYKKRPELINLVEEFYRTYRALVERYTYLTREIRQNIAPALQAQLGVSSESAQNSPVDLHLKRGIDGPDIISPSYSYTGASEFDYDSPTEVSTKGHTDDEFSPLGIQTNYERRAFGFKPRFPNLEESSHRASESDGTADVDIAQLQKELLRLQDENKDLVFKSTEDITKLKNLQLELSSLQSRVRNLEAEDKLTKKRLKSVQEKEQKLEAENLKLSHALISSKEEKTELLEQKKKVAEDSRVAEQTIERLEDESKAQVLAAQSQHLESSENLKRSEETVQKLQLALTTLEEERLKDSFLIEIFEQQSQDLLKKISDIEKENAFLTDQGSAQAAEIQNLQKQLTDALKATRLLEQALDATLQEKTCTEQEKSLAVSQVKGLQKDVEETQRDREEQAKNIARLKDIILKLEEEGLRVQSEKMENAKYVCKLETSIEDGQRLIDTLHASCQQYEERCQSLEEKYDQSNEKLLSSSQEVSKLQHEVQTLEEMVTSSQMRSEDLQKKVSSLVVEKSSLMDEMEKKLEIVKGQCTKMQKVVQDQAEETDGLRKEYVKQLDKVRSLEEELSLVSKEKIAFVEKETEALLVHQQLENEHTQVKQQIELSVTLTEDLNNKLSCLELEKTELVLKNQQMQQNLFELQALNSDLSGHCFESKKNIQAAEEAAREAQKELALSLSKVKKLHEDSHAKDELLNRMMSDVKSLETRVAQYREENSSLRDEVDKCTRNLAVLEANNNGLDSRLSDLATLNTSLAEQVSEKEKSIQHLTHELSAAQMQVVALKEDLQLKTSLTLDLQQKISALEKQLKLLHAELLESSAMKQSMEAVVEGLQNENSETKEANQALIHEQERLLNDVALLKNINQDVEANISHLAREKASLQEEAVTHSKQCTDLVQRITGLETDCEAARQEIVTLRGHFAESEEENSKKLFEAEGRVQDLQLKLSNVLAEEASLAEQLAERICRIHTLETALFDLQKDNSALNEDLGQLQQQVSSFQIREASLLTEMHDSSDLIQTLSAEVERLKRVVLNAEETEKRLSLEQKKALEECALLQKNIENLQQDLEISCEERATFLNDIARHSGQSSELDCEVQKLEAEKYCLQQELFRAQQVEHQLKEDLEKLDEERQKLSDILDFQKKKMEKQEEDLQNLQLELSSTKDEQQVVADKMNLLAELSDFQKKKVEKQEEDLQNLQLELSFTKDEQQVVADKMNLLAEEKRLLLQKLKECEQELEQARESCLRLQTDLSELQQVTTNINIEVGNKVEEVRVLQENTSVLQAAKSELEQKLELWSRQALAREDQEKTLAEMLAAAQEENSKLEVHIVDAQRRMIETNEECNRHREGFEALMHELAAVRTAKKEMEQELIGLQEDKTTCYHKLEKLQQELRCLQDQKDKSDSELEMAILQGHEHMSKVSSLQEQFLSAEKLKLEMNKKYSKLTEEWDAAERKLQEEIVQLRLTSFEEKEKLELQHKRVLELGDEVCHFRAEKEALSSDKAFIENQMMDLQQHLVGLKFQLSEKQENCSKLSAQAELLQEGVLLKENINLELQKQGQLVRDENKELILKIQSRDGQLVQLKANLEILEDQLHEHQERLYESQSKSKLSEVAYQLQGEEHLSLELQNKELTGALSKVKAENAMLETKLAAEAASLDVVKQELFVLNKRIGNTLNGQPAKTRETSLCASQEHGQQFLWMISKINDLHKMLYNNLSGEQAFERHKSVISQENLSGLQMKQVDLQQPLPTFDLRKPAFSTEVLADRDLMKIEAGCSSSFEIMNQDQEGLFDAMVNAIDNLEENILVLLNGSHRAERKPSIPEQQEQVSHLQEKSGHLNVEVELYKKEICHLKKILQGEEFQEEGDIGHTDVRVVQVMLLNLQKSLIMLEEKVRGLNEEVELESGQKRSLQLLLADLQVNGLSYALLLKKKMLLFCEGMKRLVHDWSEKAYDKERNQFIECIDKLSRAEALCKSLDIQDEENRRCVEEGTDLASQPTGASTVLLQLEKRVEEFSLLCEAVEDMLPRTYWHDQCKDGQEQGLNSISTSSNDSLQLDSNHESPLPQEQQLLTEHIGSEMEIDMEEADLSVDTMHEDTEMVDEVGVDQKKEIELFEGLARLHINLGMRLHQALMDEKLETELQELKEERNKLKDDLQARVEQVQSMEAELKKLQVILESGREGDEILDPRQQQQWLQSKKRAEKRARKLSRELVLQREHVRNMQDTVVAWTEQEELATELLEKQVLFLVSKECSPTMEGWDANQVTHLMQEMQNRKALTRRHSMDLQSVELELQRVGSSIDSTQQQLLKEEEQEQEANQDGKDRGTMSVDAAASEAMKNHHKLRRFGLAWLILLFSTSRKRLVKERPKDKITATTASPKEAQRHHMSTSTVLSSLVAQTRRMRCCACASSSDQLKSLDGK